MSSDERVNALHDEVMQGRDEHWMDYCARLFGTLTLLERVQVLALIGHVYALSREPDYAKGFVVRMPGDHGSTFSTEWLK